MTELAWDRALGRGGLPYVAGREPRDALFVRLDVGGAGPDAPRVDDLLEFQAGRVVEDCIGRVGVGWSCGRRDGDQIDGEFHGVGTYWLRGVWWENKPGGEVSGYEKSQKSRSAKAADGTRSYSEYARISCFF